MRNSFGRRGLIRGPKICNNKPPGVLRRAESEYDTGFGRRRPCEAVGPEIFFGLNMPTKIGDQKECWIPIPEFEERHGAHYLYFGT